MDLNSRKKAFINLGKFLAAYTTDHPESTNIDQEQAQALDQAIFIALQHNGWFTKEDIYFTLNQWAHNLQKEKLNHWLSTYDLTDNSAKTVAIIMAGNIPLVGFHDFLSVLISGHRALIKQSSKDKHLLPFMADFLVKQEASFKNHIEFTDEKLTDFDAVIATGSDNTARYFEYYFSKKPHIIRRNRNSVAILTGDEKPEELKKLGEDLFRYYGLGCRNVSKVFIPKNYNLENFFNAIYDWNPIINSHKYANNYDYNKAVYLMSEFKIFDNGFLILKEESGYTSPIACLFYEYYEDEKSLTSKLENDQEQIQAIISSKSSIKNTLEFGQTQRPKLDDYADGVDTLAFLSKL